VIEETIRHILAARRPSSSENLDGFIHDFDFFLFDARLFESVRFVKSRDRLSCLNIAAPLRLGAQTLQQVADSLREVWKRVSYNEFAASSVAWYREATALRFITAAGANLCVTGTLITTGPEYQALVRQFERDFSPLPSLAGGVPEWFAA
jgi:hypothetical protein